jgi:hypothetical protein
MQALNTKVATNTGLALSGTSISSQILTGLAIVVILYIVMSVLDYIYRSYLTMWSNRVELFPNTYASGSKMFTAIQNPSNPISKTVYFSNNQRSGIEFSYAMFVYISSPTYASGNAQLYHIMHKGYAKPYPLMGPGIFAWGDKNTIRVYMNCYSTWNNYVDIDNIPVDKWFHIVVSCKGNTTYVYINGNLKSKLNMVGNTPPYQNYGNVYLFSSRTQQIHSMKTKSITNDSHLSPNDGSELKNLLFAGSASGMVSRVTYFTYALSYTEIQALMAVGPSKQIEGPNMSLTPYLSDTWWTNPVGP